MEAAEAQKPPATIEASAGETCAERVAQAAAALAEEDYTTALGLLLGDERVEAAKDGKGNAMVVSSQAIHCISSSLSLTGTK